MDITVAYTIWTVVAVVIFVGIVIWAWSGKRKSGFDAAARMPLDEDEAGVRPRSSGQVETHSQRGKIGV